MPKYRGHKSKFKMDENSTTELSGILDEEFEFCSFAPPEEYIPLPETKLFPEKPKSAEDDIASEDQVEAMKTDKALVEKCQDQQAPVTEKEAA